MKNAVDTFNALNGQLAKRSQLEELVEYAKKQSQTEVVNRLQMLLDFYPDNEFNIIIDRPAVHVAVKSTKNKNKGLGHYFTGIDEVVGFEEAQVRTMGLGKPVTPDDIYAYVTNLIVNTINKEGLLPWQKDWSSTGLSNGKEATNYESKKGYRGVNYFLLNFEVKRDENNEPYLAAKKWENPYFLTFKQIEKYNGKLVKGSNGHRVVYFTRLYGHSEQNAEGKKLEFYTYDQIKFKNWIIKHQHEILILKRGGYTVESLANTFIPILKYYNVFNGEDISGIDFGKMPVNQNALKTEQEKIDIAESIVKNYPNPPKLVFSGDPMYVPSQDTVYQPSIEKWKNGQTYYSTLFHELIHSTGSKTRLDRLVPGGIKTPQYAKEELVAEMGAVFLCAESGILFETLNNSAAYLKGWNKRLVKHMEKDNRFFFRASSKAQEASDFILDPDSNGVYAYIKEQLAKTKIEPVAASKKKSTKKNPVKKTAGKPSSTTKPSVIKLNEKKASLTEKFKKAASLRNPVSKQKKKITKAKKTALNGPMVLSGATHVVGRLAGVNRGDAPASVLDIETFAEEVLASPMQEPVKLPQPLVPKPSKNTPSIGRRINTVGRVNGESFEPVGPLAQMFSGIEVKPVGSVVITLDAEQGAGKTRLFFQAMNAYASAGYDVAFLSLEEHPDSDVFTSKRDQYLSETAKNKIVVFSDDEVNNNNIDEILNSVDVAFIDSYGKLEQILGGVELDADIRKRYDGKLIWIIYQRTSDGKMRGGSASGFDADIVAKMEKDPMGRNHKLYFNKNRYEKTPGLKFNINTQHVEYPQFETDYPAHSGAMILQ